MVIFPRILSQYTVNLIENVSPDTHTMSLSVYLATSLSVFAVVCGIFQNDHSFQRRICHNFITSLLKAEISATLFDLVTHSHHPPLRITFVVITGLLLPIQSLAAPPISHQRCQTFKRQRVSLEVSCSWPFVFCLLSSCALISLPLPHLSRTQDVRHPRGEFRPQVVPFLPSVLCQPCLVRLASTVS